MTYISNIPTTKCYVGSLLGAHCIVIKSAEWERKMNSDEGALFDQTDVTFLVDGFNSLFIAYVMSNEEVANIMVHTPYIHWCDGLINNTIKKSKLFPVNQ